MLVVAHETPGWNVEWILGADFERYRGEVYVQELGVFVLSGGACTPEDIIGKSSIADKDIMLL